MRTLPRFARRHSPLHPRAQFQGDPVRRLNDPPEANAGDIIPARPPATLPEPSTTAAPSLIHQASVTLTHANLVAVGAGTSLTLVAAPGVGFMHLLVAGQAMAGGALDADGRYSTLYVGFEEGDYWRICYGDYDEDASNFADSALLSGSSFLQLFTPIVRYDQIAGTQPLKEYSFPRRGNHDNKSLRLAANFSAFEGGDPLNTLLVSLAYLTLDLSTGAYA
jgi:hypothetical protein